MTIEQELELSYYQQVADIDAEHSVYLVQDTRSKEFFVKKLLTIYNIDIYRYLQSHPIANTPRIHLLSEDNNVLTIIEEYIPGETLEDLLKRSKTLPEKQVLEIVAKLCVILADFHHCSPAIVNRDIKPSNIKITSEGVIKLLDMNAAKWSKAGADKDTRLLGTQGYAAPEQYGFGPSSALSDIYSVGVLINVMLCGEFPNKKIAGGQLGKIARKCVELSPSARYQSIDELLDALADLSIGANIIPGRTPNWRKFLPPGFRTNRPVRYIFSALGYLVLFYFGLTLEVENAGTVELILNRIFFTIMCLCIVLFNGNYLGIQNKFILTKSKRWWVRWIGMAIVDSALLSIWVILLNTIVASFLR